MRQKRWTTILFVVLCSLFSGAAALAAAGAKVDAAAKPEKSVADDWLSGFRKPWPWLEMGLDMRLREKVARNIVTLDTNSKDSAGYSDNKYNYQRYRFRWWTKWMLDEDVDFNTRMVWEFRTWDEPGSKPQHTDFDEVLFDRFNFTLRNFLGMPVTAVLGRQDLMFGVGWLVLDGTPLDGSRTIFTDAARFTYDWKEGKTKFDLIYIDMAAASDRWLKPINDHKRYLTEQDEYGAIFYVTNNSLEKTQLEGFLMYKNDNPIDHLRSAAYGGIPPSWSKKAEIFTYGGAIAGDLAKNWKYRAEGALQTGDKQDPVSGEMRDLEAYGALTSLSYLFLDKLDNRLRVGYEYASGDDPNTKDNEQFDLLWGEWPRWSELYIYTYQKETMIAESTNLHRINVGHTFKPNDVWEIATDYHWLWADENSTPGTKTFKMSDHHKFRGQLLTCWAKYKFNKQLYGHLLGEYFLPGNYYEETNRCAAFFLRFNLEYIF